MLKRPLKRAAFFIYVILKLNLSKVNLMGAYPAVKYEIQLPVMDHHLCTNSFDSISMPVTS